MLGLRAAAVAALVVLTAVSCTGGGNAPAPSSDPAPSTARSGGTFRAGVLGDPSAPDPQVDISGYGIELGRCCLVRTLMSYNGQSAAQGGGDPRPDLASGPPTVSSDNLTWTFRIRPGLHYAPPLQSVVITAQDFIRAMERELVLKRPYGQGIEVFYDVIAGATQYAEGKADSISGMQAPNDQTLVVNLTQPAGDLAYLFALPATAPIPPNPGDPSARLGVAQGHDQDYGNFLVATGPYMIEGSERMDFSLPPRQQRPPAGIREGSLTLVRNPSWSPESDDLRKANVDRIVLTHAGATPDAAAQKVVHGDLDVVLDLSLSPDQVDRFRADPNLAPRIHVNPSGFVTTVSMNVAARPFDDLHVRRAVNDAIDKEPLARLWEANGRLVAVATHIGLDSFEDSLLVGYDPYGASSGDLAAARREMAQSRYDRNHDGRCDVSACSGVLALTRTDPPYYVELAKLVRGDLARIGIHLRIKAEDEGKAFPEVQDPANRIPMAIGDSWGPFYPSGSNIFPSVFLGRNIGGENLSLLGASPQELKGWGYTVASVPNVDARIHQCEVLTSTLQVQCWAGFDKFFMEQVAAWVPLFTSLTATIVSARVREFSFDQSTVVPAFDQIALAPG